jgi:hypothetical protein
MPVLVPPIGLQGSIVERVGAQAELSRSLGGTVNDQLALLLEHRFALTVEVIQGMRRAA